jgi:DNA mismatch repair protein MutS
MAQMGSFVPARSAHLGALDQIMTRIGASDDLAAGRSTFMVEMAETAAILKSATARSLVILDEIGRGTSTYDGIAIAWAVAEYLLRPNGPKTLFATHYLELTQLEKMFPTAVNWAVQVAEQNGQIAFLHRVTPGKGDRSYGIHVARLAGLPERVVERAEQLLTQLESRRKAKIDIAHEQLTLCLTPSS